MASRLGLLASLYLFGVAACDDPDDDRVARCRELEPRISAEAAWENIEALHEVVAESLALRCDEVLAEADD